MIIGMDSFDSAVAETTELKPCGICGRTFRPDALERHHKICQKSSEKKRRIFDSKKQRAVESDQANGNPVPKPVKTSQPPASRKQGNKRKPPQAKTAAQPPKKPNENSTDSKDSKPKSNWREKHEELVRTIRRSREGDKNNNDTSTNSKSYVPSDYVQCPSCNRNFNQRAAERHIPWCQQKRTNTPKSPAVDEAKEKLIARVKYRVPPPGKVKKAPAKSKTAGHEAPAKPKTADHEAPAKPKTAGHEAPAKPKTADHEVKDKEPRIEREKETHSSPPSLVDNRTVTSNGNASRTRKRDYGYGSRSGDSKSSTPTDSFSHIIKFKEKFPNHIKPKRGVDLEESFSAEQLQELMRCSRLADDRCPKTVPGVRLSGSNNHNNWTSGWTKGSVENTSLPEVSSSEGGDTWLAKYGWGRDLDASISSSGSSSSSSLPPMSRESPSDLHVQFYCHQCNHKFPLLGAKYCCECGARRRGLGTISQAV